MQFPANGITIPSTCIVIRGTWCRPLSPPSKQARIAAQHGSPKTKGRMNVWSQVPRYLDEPEVGYTQVSTPQQHRLQQHNFRSTPDSRAFETSGLALKVPIPERTARSKYIMLLWSDTVRNQHTRIRNPARLSSKYIQGWPCWKSYATASGPIPCFSHFRLPWPAKRLTCRGTESRCRYPRANEQLVQLYSTVFRIDE